jgi:hypothetical protein
LRVFYSDLLWRISDPPLPFQTRVYRITPSEEEEISMVQLFDKQTGAEVGILTDDQFQFLVDHLEEESSDDDDYYLNRSTVDVLESAGADPELVQVLRRALGDRDEMDLRWTRS